VNLIKAALYDPAGAVSKATSSLLAMTAFDTTNLRLAITVPAHGMVRFRLRCIVTGATTCPTVFLGVLNGATVVGRVAPARDENATANAATQNFLLDAEFTATGLAPVPMNVDAAYGVEVVVAATNIKYGGPNDTTTNNAWGAFVFEAWDPQPQTTTGQLSVDANGRVDVIKVAGTTQTARDLGAQLDVAVSTRLAPTVAARTLDVSAGGEAGLDWSNIGAPTTAQNLSGTTISASQVAASVTAAVTLPTIPANWISAAGIAASALNGKGDWNIGKTGYSLTQAFPANFASLSITAGGLVDVTQAAADKAWSTAARLLTAGTNIVLAKGVGVTGLNDLDVVGVRAAVGLASANLDTQLSAIAGYIDTEVAVVQSAVIAIKAKTDSLTFTLAGKLDAHVLAVNGILMQGLGTDVSPWRSV
jgi:hypothetical protein